MITLLKYFKTLRLTAKTYYILLFKISPIRITNLKVSELDNCTIS